MRASRTGIALLLVAAFAGCGSGGHKQGLTNGQAQALIAQLEAARASAAARDVGGAETTLTNFRRSVARLQRQGALSAETARALRIGAARILARVKSDSAPPPTQPAPPVTATTPAPLPPGQAKKKDRKKHDNGKGKKHGKEGGD